ESGAARAAFAGRRTKHIKTSEHPTIVQSEAEHFFFSFKEEERKPTPSSLHACVPAMNGKGVKRPLIRTAVSSSTGTCVSQPQPRGNGGGGGGDATSMGTPRNWTSSSSPRNLRSPPGRPYCCGCRRWNGSKLRLASIVGIHVLGLMACPCRGFTPPSAAAAASLLSDGQRNSEFECRSSAVDSPDDGGRYGAAGDFRWWAEAGGE
ncbi:unnamed protein product, partial [Laminaria digitata]